MITIPDAAWGALGGAAISAFSAWLVTKTNNKSSEARQTAQLTHDQAERRKDRLLSLRRELYAQAAVEQHRLHAFLSALPNFDFTAGGLQTGFQPFFEIASKVMLVAEPETSVLISDVVHKYGLLSIRAMHDVREAAEAKADFDAATEHEEKMAAEVRRLRDAVIDSAPSDPAKSHLTQLRASLARQNDLAAQARVRRLVAQEEFYRRAQKFQLQLFDQLAKLTPEQFALMRALRQDLGISGDFTELERRSEGQISSLGGMLREAIASSERDAATEGD